MMTVRIIVGDALAELRKMPSNSVHCCVTSPPYWGLRDYGVDGQIGLERTPSDYVAKLIAVFSEVRRVLRDDGTLWLNLGDCYASFGGTGTQGSTGQRADRRHTQVKLLERRSDDIKPKDLIGIPWRVALALQTQGWWLRSDIIWSKPNPMPESVTDRPTRAHEYVFLMAKNEHYWYDAAAIKEKAISNHRSGNGYGRPEQLSRGGRGQAAGWNDIGGSRNARSVWEIAAEPFREAHFATFPTDLARRCILAGSPPGGVVLDPFGGAGTTGLVAQSLGRNATLIELNPDYAAMAERRMKRGQPGLVLGSAFCDDAAG